MNDGGLELKTPDGRLVTRRVGELRPHASYVRHHLAVSASKLSALAEKPDLAFLEPLAITQDRTIIDGYVRWELARHLGREDLQCLEYRLSESDALQWLIQRHRRSTGLSSFTRILLALDLEPELREKARSNQQMGGQVKGSSKLTRAEKIDVRAQIAFLAGASVGNVDKVKHLKTAAHHELLMALHAGEISIHRAWTWCKQASSEQRESLMQYRSERGVRKTIGVLLSRHRSNASAKHNDLSDVVNRLGALDARELASIGIMTIKAPGRMLCVTEELLRALGLQKDICFPPSH